MIRPAAESDLSAILEIYAPYVLTSTATFEYTVPTAEAFAQRFQTIAAQFPWLVYEEKGEILGYVYASAPYAREAYSWCAEPSVYLRPDCVGRGIGSRLYRALEQILLYQGYQLLYALVTGENAGSLRFHERHGYVQKVSYQNIGFKFGRWLGLVWLEKRLKPVEIPISKPTPWKEIMHNDDSRAVILDILSIS